MELILALVLFIGLIACWLVLPGSTTTTALVIENEQPEATGLGQTTVGHSV